MFRKFILIIAILSIAGLITAGWACSHCNGKSQTTEMKAGECPGMTQTANSQECNSTGQCPENKKAEMKDGKCVGECPKHDKKASGECTMKAGSNPEATATAEKIVDTKAGLPDGLVEGNVYTLLDGTKRFVCPVMGSHMNVADNKGHFDKDGKRYYVCCEGCVDKMAADPKKFLDALVIPANIEKVEGKNEIFKCVVSKEHGTVSKKTLYSDYHGMRYYFCCKDCPGPFEKNPEKYIIKTPAKDAGKTKS